MRQSIFANAFLTLLFLLLHPYCGQTASLQSIGMRAGVASPATVVQNTLAAGLRMPFTTSASDVCLAPFVDYWSGAWKHKGRDWSWRLIAFGMSMKKSFHFARTDVSPFVGAGLGININYSNNRIELREQTVKKGIDADLAIHCVGGFSFPVAKDFLADIELKYVAAGLVDYASFMLGLNYRIGRPSL